MDHVAAGEATRQGARTRRRRMRDQARSQQHTVHTPGSHRYQTPEWLERSFVLPLTQPEASDVPSQSVPHHDDDPRSRVEPGVIPDEALADPVPPGGFVRPPSEHIDFARVVRRADLCRTAGRLAWATAGLAGLTLIAYLLTTSVVVLWLAVGLGLTSVAAFGLRQQLMRAPVPVVRR